MAFGQPDNNNQLGGNINQIGSLGSLPIPDFNELVSGKLDSVEQPVEQQQQQDFLNNPVHSQVDLYTDNDFLLSEPDANEDDELEERKKKGQSDFYSMFLKRGSIGIYALDSPFEQKFSDMLEMNQKFHAAIDQLATEHPGVEGIYVDKYDIASTMAGMEDIPDEDLTRYKPEYSKVDNMVRPPKLVDPVDLKFISEREREKIATGDFDLRDELSTAEGVIKNTETMLGAQWLQDPEIQENWDKPSVLFKAPDYRGMNKKMAGINDSVIDFTNKLAEDESFIKAVYDSYGEKTTPDIVQKEFIDQVSLFSYNQYAAAGVVPEIDDEVKKDTELVKLLTSEKYTNATSSQKSAYLLNYIQRSGKYAGVEKQTFAKLQKYRYPSLDQVVNKANASDLNDDVRQISNVNTVYKSTATEKVSGAKTISVKKKTYDPETTEFGEETQTFQKLRQNVTIPRAEVFNKKYGTKFTDDDIEKLIRRVAKSSFENKTAADFESHGIPKAMYSELLDLVYNRDTKRNYKLIEDYLNETAEMDYENENSRWHRFKVGTKYRSQKYLPIYSFIAKVNETDALESVYSKQKAGIPLNASDELLIKSVGLHNYIESITPESLWYDAGKNILPGTVNFLIDYALTKGMGTAEAEAAKIAMRRLITTAESQVISKFSSASISALAGAWRHLATTTVSRLEDISSAAEARLLPDNTYYFDTASSKYYQEINDKDTTYLEAFLKEYANQYQEFATEALGESIEAIKWSGALGAFTKRLGMSTVVGKRVIEFMEKNREYTNKLWLQYLSKLRPEFVPRPGQFDKSLILSYLKSSGSAVLRATGTQSLPIEYLEEFVSNRIQPIIEQTEDPIWRNFNGTVMKELQQTAVGLLPILAFGHVIQTPSYINAALRSRESRAYNQIVNSLMNYSDEEYNKYSGEVSQAINVYIDDPDLQDEAREIVNLRNKFMAGTVGDKFNGQKFSDYVKGLANQTINAVKISKQIRSGEIKTQQDFDNVLAKHGITDEVMLDNLGQQFNSYNAWQTRVAEDKQFAVKYDTYSKYVNSIDTKYKSIHDNLRQYAEGKVSIINLANVKQEIDNSDFTPTQVKKLTSLWEKAVDVEQYNLRFKQRYAAANTEEPVSYSTSDGFVTFTKQADGTYSYSLNDKDVSYTSEEAEGLVLSGLFNDRNNINHQNLDVLANIVAKSNLSDSTKSKIASAMNNLKLEQLRTENPVLTKSSLEAVARLLRGMNSFAKLMPSKETLTKVKEYVRKAIKESLATGTLHEGELKDFVYSISPNTELFDADFIVELDKITRAKESTQVKEQAPAGEVVNNTKLHPFEKLANKLRKVKLSSMFEFSKEARKTAKIKKLNDILNDLVQAGVIRKSEKRLITFVVSQVPISLIGFEDIVYGANYEYSEVTRTITIPADATVVENNASFIWSFLEEFMHSVHHKIGLEMSVPTDATPEQITEILKSKSKTAGATILAYFDSFTLSKEEVSRLKNNNSHVDKNSNQPQLSDEDFAVKIVIEATPSRLFDLGYTRNANGNFVIGGVEVSDDLIASSAKRISMFTNQGYELDMAVYYGTRFDEFFARTFADSMINAGIKKGMKKKSPILQLLNTAHEWTAKNIHAKIFMAMRDKKVFDIPSPETVSNSGIDSKLFKSLGFDSVHEQYIFSYLTALANQFDNNELLFGLDEDGNIEVVERDKKNAFRPKLHEYLTQLGIENAFYHGSPHGEFEMFSHAKKGTGADSGRNTGDWGSGFYFANNLKDAEGYAKNLADAKKTGKPFLYGVRLKFYNPFDFTKLFRYNEYVNSNFKDIVYGNDPTKYDTKNINYLSQFGFDSVEEFELMQELFGSVEDNWGQVDITEKLREKGYDATISYNGNEYVVYEPDQIEILGNEYLVGAEPPSILSTALKGVDFKALVNSALTSDKFVNVLKSKLGRNYISHLSKFAQTIHGKTIKLTKLTDDRLVNLSSVLLAAFENASSQAYYDSGSIYGNDRDSILNFLNDFYFKVDSESIGSGFSEQDTFVLGKNMANDIEESFSIANQLNMTGEFLDGYIKMFRKIEDSQIAEFLNELYHKMIRSTENQFRIGEILSQDYSKFYSETAALNYDSSVVEDWDSSFNAAIEHLQTNGVEITHRFKDYAFLFKGNIYSENQIKPVTVLISDDFHTSEQFPYIHYLAGNKKATVIPFSIPSGDVLIHASEGVEEMMFQFNGRINLHPAIGEISVNTDVNVAKISEDEVLITPPSEVTTPKDYFRYEVAPEYKELKVKIFDVDFYYKDIRVADALRYAIGNHIFESMYPEYHVNKRELFYKDTVFINNKYPVNFTSLSKIDIISNSLESWEKKEPISDFGSYLNQQVLNGVKRVAIAIDRENSSRAYMVYDLERDMYGKESTEFLVETNFIMPTPNQVFPVSHPKNYTEETVESSRPVKNVFVGGTTLAKNEFKETKSVGYYNQLRNKFLEMETEFKKTYPNFVTNLYELGVSSTGYSGTVSRHTILSYQNHVKYLLNDENFRNKSGIDRIFNTITNPSKQKSTDLKQVVAENFVLHQRLFFATGFYRGFDGKLRYEIPTGKFNSNSQKILDNVQYGTMFGKVKDFLDNELLYKLYPEIAEYTVRVQFTPMVSNIEDTVVINGLFDINNKIIVIKPPVAKIKPYDDAEDLADFEIGEAVIAKGDTPVKIGYSAKVFESVFIHELQHLIQDIEGFAQGTNPEAAGSYDLYYNTVGEIEARSASMRNTNRAWFTESGLMYINPNLTEEFKPKERVVKRSFIAALEKQTQSGIKETTPNVEDWSKDVESTAKALEGVDETQLISGEDVWNNATKAGSENNDFIENMEEYEGQIKGRQYLKVPISIDLLRANDKDLNEYLNDIDTSVKKRKIETPIIVGDAERGAFETTKDGVIDGFHRAEQAIINGEKNIIAFVPINSKIISEAYHKAKQDGSNPELVKAVEELVRYDEKRFVYWLRNHTLTTLKPRINDSKDVPGRQIKRSFYRNGSSVDISNFTAIIHQAKQNNTFVRPDVVKQIIDDIANKVVTVSNPNEYIKEIVRYYKSYLLKEKTDTPIRLKKTDLDYIMFVPNRKNLSDYKKDIDIIQKVVNDVNFRALYSKIPELRRLAKARAARKYADNIPFYDALKKLAKVNQAIFDNTHDLEVFANNLKAEPSDVSVAAFEQYAEDMYKIHREQFGEYTQRNQTVDQDDYDDMVALVTNLRQYYSQFVNLNNERILEFFNVELTDLTYAELKKYIDNMSEIANNNAISHGILKFLNKYRANKFYADYLESRDSFYIDILNKKTSRSRLVDALLGWTGGHGNIKLYDLRDVLDLVDSDMKNKYDGLFVNTIFEPMRKSTVDMDNIYSKIMEDIEPSESMKQLGAQHFAGIVGLLTQKPKLKLSNKSLEYLQSVGVDVTELRAGEVLSSNEVYSERILAYNALRARLNEYIADSISISMLQPVSEITDYAMKEVVKDIELATHKTKSEVESVFSELSDYIKKNHAALHSENFREVLQKIIDQQESVLSPDEADYLYKSRKIMSDIKDGIYTDGKTLSYVSEVVSGEKFIEIDDYVPIIRFRDFYDPYESTDITSVGQTSPKVLQYRFYSDVNINQGFLEGRKSGVTMALETNLYKMIRQRADQQLFYILNAEHGSFVEQLVETPLFKNYYGEENFNRQSAALIKAHIEAYFNRGFTRSKIDLRKNRTLRTVQDRLNNMKVMYVGFILKSIAQTTSTILGAQKMAGNPAKKAYYLGWGYKNAIGYFNNKQIEQFVKDASPEVYYRGLPDYDINNEVKDTILGKYMSIIKEMRGQNKWQENNDSIFRKTQLAGVVFFDKFAAVATFLGAYKSYMDSKGSEVDFNIVDEEAAKFATDSVIATQSTDTSLYKSAVQNNIYIGSGTEFNMQGALGELMNQSYFAFKSFSLTDVRQNIKNRRRFWQAIANRDVEGAVTEAGNNFYNYAGKFAFHYLRGLSMIPITYLMEAMYGNDGDDDRDKYLNVGNSLFTSMADYFVLQEPMQYAFVKTAEHLDKRQRGRELPYEISYRYYSDTPSLTGFIDDIYEGQTDNIMNTYSYMSESGMQDGEISQYINTGLNLSVLFGFGFGGYSEMSELARQSKYYMERRENN